MGAFAPDPFRTPPLLLVVFGLDIRSIGSGELGPDFPRLGGVRVGRTLTKPRPNSLSIPRELGPDIRSVLTLTLAFTFFL